MFPRTTPPRESARPRPGQAKSPIPKRRPRKGGRRWRKHANAAPSKACFASHRGAPRALAPAGSASRAGMHASPRAASSPLSAARGWRCIWLGAIPRQPWLRCGGAPTRSSILTAWWRVGGLPRSSMPSLLVRSLGGLYGLLRLLLLADPRLVMYLHRLLFLRRLLSPSRLHLLLPSPSRSLQLLPRPRPRPRLCLRRYWHPRLPVPLRATSPRWRRG